MLTRGILWDVFSEWVDLAYNSIFPLGLSLQSPIKIIQKLYNGKKTKEKQPDMLGRIV